MSRVALLALSLALASCILPVAPAEASCTGDDYEVQSWCHYDPTLWCMLYVSTDVAWVCVEGHELDALA